MVESPQLAICCPNGTATSMLNNVVNDLATRSCEPSLDQSKHVQHQSLCAATYISNFSVQTLLLSVGLPYSPLLARLSRYAITDGEVVALASVFGTNIRVTTLMYVCLICVCSNIDSLLMSC